jgi:hypothetical protein
VHGDRLVQIGSGPWPEHSWRMFSHVVAHDRPSGGARAADTVLQRGEVELQIREVTGDAKHPFWGPAWEGAHWSSPSTTAKTGRRWLKVGRPEEGWVAQAVRMKSTREWRNAWQ